MTELGKSELLEVLLADYYSLGGQMIDGRWKIEENKIVPLEDSLANITSNLEMFDDENSRDYFEAVEEMTGIVRYY